ncbi:hypothetical protein FEE95_11445 [Maribacter algarum]|uniref:Thiol:disulfide interchange protein DsbD n=1 Tax=Maribacter algarum (ex Zhang et al. 2020) TaxID=2578118 RepID=A0A5S3PVT9_9FLAO|nr:thioredoxin family protein [Maribacter algarum]TMM57098.1 hypothetical protein FEE95_11445 [Maribacter algarum]
MKQFVLGVLLVFSALFVFGQTDDEPVLWSQEINKISDTEYDLIFKAKVFDGWHLYSQHTAEGGAFPTEFKFVGLETDYKSIGETNESKTYTDYSEIFEVEETFFKGKAQFTQRIKLLNSDVRQIDVSVSYQICSDEVCIPGFADFNFVLDGGDAVIENQTVDARSLAMTNALKLDLKNKELLNSAEDRIEKDSTIWGIFGLGFLGGLIALLTPCMFPMIPLTVSFFTKQSQNKSKGIANAFLYGFFIILIYVLLSVPFHLFDSIDSQILNTISTNMWLNIGFFIIFLFFAFSFFGYYELTLPNSWANKMDENSTKIGGVIGIFFMAVTLAIVSFSCTGPILGFLLGGTTLAEGDVATNLTAGMMGFGVAIALPFALFALFPAWLNSLPKSGGWMTTVKVVLGFLELALALKFLSNADLVGHWGILKREIFIGIWIVLFVLLALYLFGLFRFPHDGPKQKLSNGRKGVGFLSAVFSLYLILGLAKVVDLKPLSGILPPEFYSVFETESDCPLGLNCFKDFDEGLAYAKSVNKPILLDFTGWACANCRKMEEQVWSETDIYPILRDEYVLISLYVDDNIKKLPEDQQFDFQYASGRVKTIETVGQKWGTFQTLNFNAASQPYYVLLSPDLEVLNSAVQYTDRDAYKAWLNSGLEKHKVLAQEKAPIF